MTEENQNPPPGYWRKCHAISEATNKSLLKEIKRLTAQNAELRRALGQPVPLSSWQKTERERDLLAAQVVAIREALDVAMEVLYDVDTNNVVADYGSEHLAISRHDAPKIRKVVAMANELPDLSAAEAILRERDAKVLEEALEKIQQRYSLTYQTTDYFRRLATERRAGK